MNTSAPFLSIIVPVLNEAPSLRQFLGQLPQRGADLEIIVVDGGSSDGTATIALPLADRVITTQPGRAAQMNAGAAIARGEALWFLHADAEVFANSGDRIQEALADPRVAGGCFRLRYPRRQVIYRVSDSLGNLGVHLFGFALGDHGIFCRRAAFETVGRYPSVPILEDAELYRRLRRAGRMRQLRDAIVSSPRTFEKFGPYRTTCVYFAILVLYVGGAPITWLNRIYRRFHRLAARGDAVAAAGAVTRFS